jgi:hypothetical protein
MFDLAQWFVIMQAWALMIHHDGWISIGMVRIGYIA